MSPEDVAGAGRDVELGAMGGEGAGARVRR